MNAIGCRAIWRVGEDDMQLARHQIASKRRELDDVISAIHGVQFFLSCITAVSSNPNQSMKNENGNDSVVVQQSYPGIAYFIAYRETESCTEDTIFATLHNQDVEPEIKHIRTARRAGVNATIENAARQLFQVVKDHNNPMMVEMLNDSIAHCQNGAGQSDSNREQTPSQPCRLVVVNATEFGEKLQNAATKLTSDGLLIDLDIPTIFQKRCLSSTTVDVTATLQKIRKVMKLCHHALYRGNIYAKPAGAMFTYVKMMDVRSYLHKLLTNEPLREQVLNNFQILERVLCHQACEIVEQLTFDKDLIEVSNGKCFSIKARGFVNCPIEECRRGKTSPRAFIRYDSSTPPEPGYFRDGILNSFPDADTRGKFLNKFYQCLMAHRFPHKVRKLVVAGPKDSGKTSWASVFWRIIPPDNIASITNEGQFSAAMLTDDTELVLVDEWSANTLQSDLAKTILQGGWLVTAVKHSSPKFVVNNSPFYLTTNNVPDFRDENENVMRRIAVYNTTSLPQVTAGVDRWMYDHAMDCIAWTAGEIEAHHHCIEEEELWYEDHNDDGSELTINPVDQGKSLWDSQAMKEITNEDILSSEDEASTSTQQPIHHSLTSHSKRRRIERRRRQRRPLSSTDSGEEDAILSSALDQLDCDTRVRQFLRSVTEAHSTEEENSCQHSNESHNSHQSYNIEHPRRSDESQHSYESDYSHRSLHLHPSNESHHLHE